jgi:ankyrin repeat protein
LELAIWVYLDLLEVNYLYDYLVKNRQNVEMEREMGSVFDAAKAGNLGKYEYDELEYKADINLRDLNRNTPLMLAAANGHKDSVEFLLKKGANVNDKNDEGNTPLILAVANGHKNPVESLLKKGANVNDKNNEGNSAVHQAIIQIRIEASRGVKKKCL